MLGRFAAAAALLALASCAGLEPAGRNAARNASEAVPAAAPRTSAPIAPAPSSVSPPQSMQQTQAAPSVAAPSVTAPPPPPPARADQDSDVTVHAPARQVEPPRGDPRSVAERREDIQTWDRCVLAVQQTYQADPTEPVLETPEDVCRRQLGQASRTAVPTSRLVRPH
ncbi:MAG: hypothetical protein JSS00_09090 [Proteobacteria bacterium]|nr:hypothetical protein [Pseudomonadota bacterium]